MTFEVSKGNVFFLSASDPSMCPSIQFKGQNTNCLKESQLIQKKENKTVVQNFQKNTMEGPGCGSVCRPESDPGFHSQHKTEQNRRATKDRSRMHDKVIFGK